MLSQRRALEKGSRLQLQGSDDARWGRNAKVAEIAEKILANPRWAVRWTKTVANQPLKALSAQLSEAAIAYEILSNMMQDRKEAVAAIVEKRKPKYSGE